MIIADFLKALGQLGDPRFRSVLFKGLGLTFGLLFLIYAVFIWVIGIFVPDTLTLPVIGTVNWVDNVVSIGSIFLMIGLSVFLMVPVASAFTGIFLDEVSEAVEDRHYPGLPTVPPLPMGEIIKDSLAFLGVIIGANVIALVIYIATNLAAPLVFWALNGFLLGREYFQMVAMRRLGRAGAKAARKRHMPLIWLAGALMAVPLTIPLVNLLVPVLGAATFTHLFMRLEGQRLA